MNDLVDWADLKAFRRYCEWSRSAPRHAQEFDPKQWPSHAEHIRAEARRIREMEEK